MKTNFLPHFIKLILSFALCFCSLSALSQAAAAPPGAPSTSGPTAPGAGGSSCAKKQSLDTQSLTTLNDSIKGSLNSSLLSGFATTANGIANQLKGFGLALGGTLLLISMFSALAKAMVSNKSYGDIVVDHLITGAIIAAVIGSYETFSNYIVYVATYLNVIVGGTSPFDAILSLVGNFLTSFIGISKQISNSLACGGILDITFTLILDVIVASLLLLIALVFVLTAIGEIIYCLMLGPIALGVGIIVGPLALGTIAADFTKEYFGKWLGFVSAAALTQFVVYAILKLLGSFVQQGMSPGGSFAAQALGIALIAMSAGKIIANAPGMAAALVPGTHGMKGGGGGSVAGGMAIASGAIAGAVAGAASGIAAGASAISGGGGISSAAQAAGSAAAGKSASVSQAVSKAFGSALGADPKSMEATKAAISTPFTAANAVGQRAIDAAKGVSNSLADTNFNWSGNKGTQTQSPSGASGDDLASKAEKNAPGRQEKQWAAGADFRAGDKSSGEASGSTNQAKPTGVDSRPNKGLTS